MSVIALGEAKEDLQGSPLVFNQFSEKSFAKWSFKK